jgi:hypothetical protein
MAGEMFVEESADESGGGHDAAAMVPGRSEMQPAVDVGERR